MNVWEAYREERTREDFGEIRLYLNSRPRISLSTDTIKDNYREILMNQGIEMKYDGEQRYLISKNIMYDLFISLYDVNTSASLALRISKPLNDHTIDRIRSFARRLKKPNIEMRVMGLLNDDKVMLNEIDKVYRTVKCSMLELDLFGNEIRHIAIDTRLGMSFNLLLLNRIYRPHELVTSMTSDEFDMLRSPLNFV